MSAQLADGGVVVWTDLSCNSGTPKAVVPVTTIETTEEIVNLLVTRRLTFRVSSAWLDLAELVMRRVIRVTYRDATLMEYRISQIVDSSGGDNLVTVTALGIEYDMAERDTPLYVTASTVVSFTVPVYSFEISQALTDYVLANLPAYWDLGTVTPTGPAVVSLSSDTPLSAALKFAAAANQATGAVYEISARRNGVTGYYLDLTAYGASAAVVDIRTNKNLQGVTRTQRTHQQTTRCAVIGSGGGVGRPYYRVTAVSANTYIEVVDMASGEGPVRETDQFDNMYIVDDGNSTHQITGSSRQSATTSRFTMASTTGIVVGELVGLVLDSGKNEIPYVDSPSLQTTWGKKLGFLSPGHDQYTNFMLNGDMSAWSGSVADDVGECQWNTTGTAPTKSLSTFYTGGASALIYAASSSVSAVVNGPWVAVGDVVTQTATVRIVAYDAANYLRFTNPDTAATIEYSLDSSFGALNVWIQKTVSTTITGAKKLSSISTMVITGISGNSVYFDSHSLTISPAAVAWRVGSGPAKMIQAANVHLGTNGAPLVEYAIRCIDLFRVDPTGAGLYESLSLGGNATLTDTALGISTTQRVLKIVTNLTVAHDTQLVLANAASQLTRLLAA